MIYQYMIGRNIFLKNVSILHKLVPCQADLWLEEKIFGNMCGLIEVFKLVKMEERFCESDSAAF